MARAPHIRPLLVVVEVVVLLLARQVQCSSRLVSDVPQLNLRRLPRKWELMLARRAQRQFEEACSLPRIALG